MTGLKLGRSDRILLLAALGAGLLGLWLVRQYLQTTADSMQRTYAARYRATRVVVAARDLPAGARLTDSQLAVRGMPADYLPSGSVPEPQFDALLNQQLRVAVKAGDPIERSQFSSTDNSLAKHLAPGWRALAIPSDTVGPLAAQLARGDRIDVGPVGAPGSAQWLEDIEVLRGPMDDGADSTALGASDATTTMPVLLLRVSPEQATRIMEALRSGAVAVLLRAPGDRARAAPAAAMLRRRAPPGHEMAIALWEIDDNRLTRRWLDLPTGAH